MKRFILLLLALWSLGASAQGVLRSVNGRVVDDRTGDAIAAATIWIDDAKTSIITNSDGYFTIKVPSTTQFLSVKHVGYNEKMVTIANGGLEIRLERVPIIIDGVVVHGGNPLKILTNAMVAAKDNYNTQPVNLTAFYREMVRKNNRYMAIAEAVVDIYKSPIDDGLDQARLYKGRRSADVERLDTLVMQYRGGVNTALLLDVAKNYDYLSFSVDSINSNYVLQFGGVTKIQGRDQYIIRFAERPNSPDMLFRGTIFVDVASYAISRVEFARNVESRSDSYLTYVLKLPLRYRVEMVGVNYVMDYLYDGVRWNYNYSKAQIDMKIVAAKRRFSANYTIISELVVTDRSATKATKFPVSERLRSSTMVFDKVVNYLDADFWSDVNVIEPEQSLETAVKRINKTIKIER